MPYHSNGERRSGAWRRRDPEPSIAGSRERHNQALEERMKAAPELPCVRRIAVTA